MSFYEDAWTVVRQVPSGTVVTYGQVATVLGSPRAARQVGFAMSKALLSETPVPWHRVINAQGRISHRGDFDRAQRQREMLEREGVEFDESERVDLVRFGHRFDPRYALQFKARVP